MNAQQESQTPDAADVHLVDLVSAALVDPNLHTDSRMRLHGELRELIESSRHGLRGRATSEAPALSPERSESGAAEVLAARELAEVLSAVLVDPNLHTDTRLRLHEQIPEMIRGVRQQDASR